MTETNFGPILTGAKELTRGIHWKDLSQNGGERSLVFTLSNGLGEVFLRQTGNFGLNITTTDSEGTPYGCWFESTPDAALSDVEAPEKDEQLLLHLLFGQAVMGDHRYLPVSRKRMRSDGDVLIMPIVEPAYRVRKAADIGTMTGQEQAGLVSRSEEKLDWYFKQVDMSKKVGTLASELMRIMQKKSNVIRGLLSETQEKSLSMLLESIPQIVNHEYVESEQIGSDPQSFQRLEMDVNRQLLFGDGDL